MREKKPDPSKKLRVGIIGGSSPDKKSILYSEKMGRLIAMNNFLLVNGGMSGVMKASAKGAKEAGGFTISILPGNSTAEGNNYSDIKIATGLGYIRNPLVVLNADILIAIDGSYGTLSEISYAKIYGKRVLGLNTWEIDGVEPFSSPEEIIEEIKDFFNIKK